VLFFSVYGCMLCLVRYLLVIITSVIDCLGRFIPEMNYYVSSGTLNLAQLNSAVVCDVIVLTTGLPDQGFEDSDNSSIFSSPSPKSRQRASARCSAEMVQNSSVQLRQRITADEDASAAVMGVQWQASHTPVVGKNVSSASDVTRPLSFVLSFPDDTSDGVIADSNNGQVLELLFYYPW